jgi:hypothetical protein
MAACKYMFVPLVLAVVYEAFTEASVRDTVSSHVRAGYAYRDFVQGKLYLSKVAAQFEGFSAAFAHLVATDETALVGAVAYCRC